MVHKLPKDVDTAIGFLIQDVLFSFVGHAGHFILEEVHDPKNASAFRELYLDPSCYAHFDIQPPYIRVVKDLLQVGNCFKFLESYVAQNAYNTHNGVIFEAFIHCIKELFTFWALKVQYYEKIFRNPTDYPSEQFNLQTLNIKVQDYLLLFQELINLVNAIKKKNLKGGHLINEVYKVEKLKGGITICLKEFVHIRKTLSLVYFKKVLLPWLLYGRIARNAQIDFFIKENECGKEHFWDTKFVIENTLNIPFFLYPFRERILIAGKSLYICGVLGERAPVILDIDIDSLIVDAYHAIDAESNSVFSGGNSLVELSPNLDLLDGVISSCVLQATSSFHSQLFDKYDLIGVCEEMCDFFLLRKSISFGEFFALAEGELNCIIPKLDLPKLQMLFENTVLRKSNTMHLSELKLTIASSTFIDRMLMLNNERGMGIDGDGRVEDLLTIEWEPPFPLNLFFNHTLMDKYKIIFRNLFYIKLLMRSLHLLNERGFKKFKYGEMKKFNMVFVLRSQMLQFLNVYSSYLYQEVVLEDYYGFINYLKRVSVNQTSITFDDVIRKHSETIDSMCNKSLLTHRELFTPLINLLHSCLNFTVYFRELFSPILQKNVGSIDDAVIRRHIIEDLENDESFSVLLKRTIKTLNTSVYIFLERLTSVTNRKPSTAATFASLANRANMNGFYTSGRVM
ncbi:hypothetical protein PCE1_002290 [Barthelona sp. PCE]